MINLSIMAFPGSSAVDVKLKEDPGIISDQKFGSCINFPTIKSAEVLTLISLRAGTNSAPIGTSPTIVSR